MPKALQSQSKAFVRTILLKAFSHAPLVLKLRTEIYLILSRIIASSHNYQHITRNPIIIKSLIRSLVAIQKIPLLSRIIISLYNYSQVIVQGFLIPKTIITRILISVHNSYLLRRENFWIPKIVTYSNQVQVIQNSLTWIRLLTILPKIYLVSHLYP